MAWFYQINSNDYKVTPKRFPKIELQSTESRHIGFDRLYSHVKWLVRFVSVCICLNEMYIYYLDWIIHFITSYLLAIKTPLAGFEMHANNCTPLIAFNARLAYGWLLVNFTEWTSRSDVSDILIRQCMFTAEHQRRCRSLSCLCRYTRENLRQLLTFHRTELPGLVRIQVCRWHFW